MHELRYRDMTNSKKLDHFYDDIDDYLEDEFVEDEMSYLYMNSGDDFDDYLDYRAVRKPGRKSRVKEMCRNESSHRNLPDGWEDLQYG